MIRIREFNYIPIEMVRSLQDLVQTLTIENPSYQKALEQGYYQIKVPQFILAYKLNPETIGVPRYFNIKKYLTRKPEIKVEIPDYKITGVVDPPDDDRYAYQNEAVKPFIKKDGILTAPPGSGKTIMALKILKERMQRTVIIAPTKAIVEQWYKVFKEYTNLSVATRKLKESTDVYISTVQALLDERPSSGIFQSFTYLVADEVHRMGAPQFNKVIGNFNTWRLGLTATPTRADGLDYLYQYHMGRVLYRLTYEDVGELRPTIYSVSVSAPVILGARTTADYVTRLFKADKFLDQVVDIVKEIRGRTIVLVDRVAAAKKLADRLDDAEAITGNESLITSTSNKRILVTTWQKGLLGYNNPDLEYLVIVSHVGTAEFAEQSVGRILRSKKGKRPTVIDIHTRGPLTAGAIKRARAWTQLGWPVNELDKASIISILKES